MSMYYYARCSVDCPCSEPHIRMDGKTPVLARNVISLWPFYTDATKVRLMKLARNNHEENGS